MVIDETYNGDLNFDDENYDKLKYGIVIFPETIEEVEIIKSLKEKLLDNNKNSKMEIDLKEDFKILDDGSRYSVPVYEVVDGKGLVLIENMSQPINFVRGSKLGSDDVNKKDGTLHEHLMVVMIHDLELKNKLVPSEETTQVILKLKEALNWQRARSIDRVKREVQETYKK